MGRHLRLAVAAALVAGCTGCASLPNGSRLHDGPAARRAVERVIGARLRESPPAVMPTGINGQSFTYTGRADARYFTLVVFDNAGATRFLLGHAAAARSSDIQALRVRNAVVIYTGGPDGALDGALRRSLAHGL